ncbi:MAG: MipA/OmpV family protein [Deferribacteraceae bacterium]|jgi:outer membrane protein|nr:MipA/OmpV family protein [Deferribacteraceae bacterium]
MKIKILLLALLLSLSLGLQAQAATVTLGVGYGYGQSEYRCVDGYMEMFGSYRGPLPIVAFDSAYFGLGVDGLALHVFNNGLLTADLLLAPFSNKYDPENSDVAVMKLLEERKMTAAAGFALGLNTPLGSLKAVGKADILRGRSDSLTLALSYSYRIMLSQRFMLIPSIGIQYANSKHYDYYYGVTVDEAINSGLPYYEVEETDHSTSFGLTAIYGFTENLGMMLSGNYTLLADSIKESPMVDESGTWGAMAAITYKIGFGDDAKRAAAPKPQPAAQTQRQTNNAQPNAHRQPNSVQPNAQRQQNSVQPNNR